MMKQPLWDKERIKYFLKNGGNIDKTTMLPYVEMAEMLRKYPKGMIVVGVS